jgi:hypothetical protein
MEEAPQITLKTAVHCKKLRVISEGKRGRIWILNGGSEEVWARTGSVKDERGAIRVRGEWESFESFESFGTALKQNMGD